MSPCLQTERSFQQIIIGLSTDRISVYGNTSHHHTEAFAKWLMNWFHRSDKVIFELRCGSIFGFCLASSLESILGFDIKFGVGIFLACVLVLLWLIAASLLSLLDHDRV